MPRFVILEHDDPFLHWDLMIEVDSLLRTWRLSKPLCSGCTESATSIGDHRLAYLDYEGPVSGGRGTVKRIDSGSFMVMSEQEGQLALRLAGERFRGLVVLDHVRREEWLVTCV